MKRKARAPRTRLERNSVVLATSTHKPSDPPRIRALGKLSGATSYLCSELQFRTYRASARFPGGAAISREPVTCPWFGLAALFFVCGSVALIEVRRVAVVPPGLHLSNLKVSKGGSSRHRSELIQERPSRCGPALCLRAMSDRPTTAGVVGCLVGRGLRRGVVHVRVLWACLVKRGLLMRVALVRVRIRPGIPRGLQERCRGASVVLRRRSPGDDPGPSAK